MIKTRAPKTSPGRALLSWYDAHRRELPWRAGPGARAAPYEVWLSEIMLQQTTVATVKGYYARFLARWPSVEALAGAKLEDVLEAWAGLGYYARARNLHACARVVAEEFGGRFPEDESALARLPGVGPYTAAAVAAIAYDAACVAVDGNVERVVTRLCAIETPPRRAKPLIREKTREMLPSTRAGDFAQALMDLGAMLCTPRAPACGVCPLAAFCAAHAQGRETQFPVKEAKRARPSRSGAIFILQQGDAVLLRRMPQKGLFGGMNVFPATPLTEDVAPEALLAHAPVDARWRALAPPVTHVFTHFSFSATVFVARLATRAAPPPGQLLPLGDLARAGLPTLMRKAALRAGLIPA